LAERSNCTFSGCVHCAIYSESFRDVQNPPHAFILFVDHWVDITC